MPAPGAKPARRFYFPWQLPRLVPFKETAQEEAERTFLTEWRYCVQTKNLAKLLSRPDYNAVGVVVREQFEKAWQYRSDQRLRDDPQRWLSDILMYHFQARQKQAQIEALLERCQGKYPQLLSAFAQRYGRRRAEVKLYEAVETILARINAAIQKARRRVPLTEADPALFLDFSDRGNGALAFRWLAWHYQPRFRTIQPLKPRDEWTSTSLAEPPMRILAKEVLAGLAQGQLPLQGATLEADQLGIGGTQSRYRALPSDSHEALRHWAEVHSALPSGQSPMPGSP